MNQPVNPRPLAISAIAYPSQCNLCDNQNLLQLNDTQPVPVPLYEMVFTIGHHNQVTLRVCAGDLVRLRSLIDEAEYKIMDGDKSFEVKG